MWKLAFAAILAATAPAQVTPGSFAKPPQNVDDALRARITEFYQDHVTGKFRKAEELVAEESKDGFYAANKPALEGFKLGEVLYSDGYKKAKVTVIGRMTMMFLGMGAPQVMDVPFPSYWKIEDGKWFWYIYSDPNRMTPFGRANGKATGATTDPAQAFANAPNVAAIQNGVKADKAEVRLARAVGSKDTVTLSNQLQGLVSMSLDSDKYPGLTVKLEPRDLKAGERSAITIESVSKNYVNQTVRLLVKPSNQLIEIAVRFQ